MSLHTRCTTAAPELVHQSTGECTLSASTVVHAARSNASSRCLIVQAVAQDPELGELLDRVEGSYLGVHRQQPGMGGMLGALMAAMS